MEQDQLTLKAPPEASLATGSLRLYAFIGDEAVGAIDLYAYDPLHERCAIGLVVGTEHRRKGIATAMLRHLDSDLRLWQLRIHLLYVDIEATNHASIALFRKAGYAECGHFSQWLRTPTGWADCLRLQHIIQ